MIERSWVVTECSLMKKRKFKTRGRFWVYIVECSDKTFYTGYTNDLLKRLEEHNSGKGRAKYLRGKIPVKLAYSKEYDNYRDAMHAEIDIKKLTRKEKVVMIKASANQRRKA